MFQLYLKVVTTSSWLASQNSGRKMVLVYDTLSKLFFNEYHINVTIASVGGYEQNMAYTLLFFSERFWEFIFLVCLFVFLIILDPYFIIIKIVELQQKKIIL